MLSADCHSPAMGRQGSERFTPRAPRIASLLSVVLVLKIACFAPSILWAQPPIAADLELEVIEPPPLATPPLSTGTIGFRLTNNGPDVAGIPFNGTPSLIMGTTGIPVDPIFGPHLWFTWNPNSDCLFLLWAIVNNDPDPPTALYEINFDTLQPGESAVCRLDYTINTLNEQNYTVEWISFQPNNTDPNTANSNVTTVFRASPLAIPTLSEYALALLASVLLTIGLFVIRRA